MKYLLTVTLVLMTSLTGIFAQEKSAIDLKNEAVEALKVNDFKKSLELYEQAMTMMTEEEVDGAMVFNAAFCARKLENHEKAVKYYAWSEKLNYKADMSCYYVGDAYSKLGKEAEMEKVLLEGIEKYKTSKYLDHMKKMVVNYYLIEGSKPYNAAGTILAGAKPSDQKELDELVAKANEKFAEAKPWFEKALNLIPNDERATKPLAEIEGRLNGQIK